MNPYAMWSDMLKAQMAWARLGMDMASTFDASGKVVGKRATMMAEACLDPTKANVAELSRMVPEKMDAFTHAAFPWLAAWSNLATGDYWKAQASFARTAGRSLAPVKRRATANARRLSR